MSDPTFSKIDFKNEKAWVWTSLNSNLWSQKFYQGPIFAEILNHFEIQMKFWSLIPFVITIESLGVSSLFMFQFVHVIIWNLAPRQLFL